MPELSNFTWLSEPGVTYGILDDGQVPLGVRITYVILIPFLAFLTVMRRPWEEVTQRQRQAMEVLMEWTTLTQAIKNNAVRRRAHTEYARLLKMIGGQGR